MAASPDSFYTVRLDPLPTRSLLFVHRQADDKRYGHESSDFPPRGASDFLRDCVIIGSMEREGWNIRLSSEGHPMDSI